MVFSVLIFKSLKSFILKKKKKHSSFLSNTIGDITHVNQQAVEVRKGAESIQISTNLCGEKKKDSSDHHTMIMWELWAF